MPSSLEQRMNNVEYKNWMKSGQALNLLAEILQPISEQTMTDFHNRLKDKNQHLVQCKSCKQKKEPADSCKTCNEWKVDIFKEHNNHKGTHWQNIDPKLWPTDVWEVAKTYMPRGHKPGVYEPDISSVLNLMYACKLFQTDIDKKRIEKVIQVRNAIMHSTDMKVSDNDMKKYLETILKMFEELVALKSADENVRANKQSVAELEKFEFNVCLEGVDATVAECAYSEPVVSQLQKIDVQQLETDLLCQRFKALEQRLDSIEDQLSNQDKLDLRNSLEEFLNNNPDLKSRFNDELTQIFETRLSEVEGHVKEIDSRLESLEKKPAKKQGGQQVMFKNHLQDYCLKNKLPPPIYEGRSHPKGHGCVVTVNGEKFETDPDDPSKKAVESEQKAAEKALEYFGSLLRSFSEIDVSANDSTTKLTTPHQPKGNEGTVGKGKPVAADKSKKTQENCHSPSEREIILNGKFPAQFLKEHCDKYPNYKIVKYVDKEVKGEGFSTTVTIVINDEEKWFEGVVANSKKSAKQNAAWEVIRQYIIPTNKPANDTSSSGVVPSSAEKAQSFSSSAVAMSSSPRVVPSSAGSIPSNAKAVSSAGSVACSTESVASGASAELMASAAESVASDTRPVASDAALMASGAEPVASDTGIVASGAGPVASDTRSVGSGAGLTASGAEPVASDTGIVASGAGPVASDTRSVGSGAGLTASGAEPVASDTGFVASDAGPVASDTRPVASGAGLTVSDAEPVASDTGPVASGAEPVTSGAEPVASGARPVALNADAVPSKSGTAPTNESKNNADIVIKNDVDTIYKNKLQEAVQKKGEKKTPDYSKTAETTYNGRKYFRGVVEFKYNIQVKSDEKCKNKKQAEQQAAEQALIQLHSNKKDDENPKGKLLELFPRDAVSFENNGSGNAFSCRLTLSLSLKIETNKLAESKRNAQQLAAKEALEKIDDGSVFNARYFDFKK